MSSINQWSVGQFSACYSYTAASATCAATLTLPPGAAPGCSWALPPQRPAAAASCRKSSWTTRTCPQRPRAQPCSSSSSRSSSSSSMHTYHKLLSKEALRICPQRSRAEPCSSDRGNTHIRHKLLQQRGRQMASCYMLPLHILLAALLQDNNTLATRTRSLHSATRHNKHNSDICLLPQQNSHPLASWPWPVLLHAVSWSPTV
jgi:hypothetical protein